MEHYAGLDVSLRLTAVCVMDERGRVVGEGKVASEPAAIAGFLQPYASTLTLAGLEAGLLAPYLYRGLAERGLPAVCIETRHMKALAAKPPGSRSQGRRIQGAPSDNAGLMIARALLAKFMSKLDQSQRLLAEVVRPLLAARKAMLEQLARLDRMVLRATRRDPICRRLMTAPGVGTVVALAFVRPSTSHNVFASRRPWRRIWA